MTRLRNGVFRARQPGVWLLALALLCGLSLLHGTSPVAWFTASALQPQIVVVNAASFAADGAVAPDTLATAFGQFVTQGNQNYIANTLPLPTTLGGVRLTINGVAANLFFVGPDQINFVVPSSLVDGPGNITITNSDGSTRTGTVTIMRTSPGIFTARANGVGVPAGYATTTGTDAIPIVNADFSPRELNPGTRERPVFLVLFGTGWRYTPAANPNDANGVAEAISATVQGVPATVVYAGAAPGLIGVDQINLIVPPELAGLGTVRLRVVAAGRATNPTSVRIGGQPPPLRPQDIAAGQSVNGALTPDDQLQLSGDGSGRLYFFDAYRLVTTAANTSIAVDLRSAQFDATVLLYQRNTDGTLVLLAADDQTGGMGNGELVNGNALLLTILPTAGEYFIFATSSTTEPYGQGNYSLNVRTNVIQTINYGANITNASIAAGDVQTSAGVLLDVYAFNAVAGDSAQIRLSSTAFDSFLILNTVAGELVTFDDNSGGVRDALATSLLRQSGTYLIIATPFEPNRTGAYTLTLNKTNALAEPEAALAPDHNGRRLNTKLRLGQAEFEQYASRHIIN
jgi:uncharacterized protein (TIGR03437 family)